MNLQDRRDFLRTSLGALGYLGLGGCGGGGQSSSAPDASGNLTHNEPATEGTAMFQVPSQTLAGIVARPETFLSAYTGLGGSTPALAYVQSQLGAPFSNLTETGAIATFASVVAFNTAPLGTSTIDPMNATLQQLLTSPQLTCGHFCKLATLFSLLGNPQLVPPDPAAGAPAKPSLHFLVWLANVPINTGFHAQLVLSNVFDDAYLLLDPTYAFALRIPFVGAGPQASLSVVENAATMLLTPIPSANMAVLDSTGTILMPQLVSTMLSGVMGPQYIYHDSIYGCEGWDNRIAQVIDNFG